MHLRTSLTVDRPVEDVFARWSDFERLPEFMTHLASVRRTGEGRSHWVAHAPVGTVEWDTIVTEEVPNRFLAWHSLAGGVQNAGSVRFTPAPDGRGTEVLVEIDYDEPRGPLGRAVAKMLGENPAQQLRDDLRRFKELVEAG